MNLSHNPIRQLMRFTPLALLLTLLPVSAQPYLTGDLSSDLEFNRRFGEGNSRLKEQEGKIVVLAFFTQWCSACRSSFAGLVPALKDRDNQNEHEIPIELIAVNLDPEEPESTNGFIVDANLEFVIDDFDLDLWNTFTEARSIPLFVVINGVENSASHRQWEVMHKQLGMRSTEEFLAILDQIKPSQSPALRANPFHSLPRDPFGWRRSSWFGRLNDQHFPWVFHEEHQWLYIARQSTPNEIVAYDSAIGWLSFTSEHASQVFSHLRNNWLQADPHAEQREFYDPTVQDWLEFPSEREARPGGRNGFTYTNALIPKGEIRSGGPPRDGIPALFHPTFVTQSEAAAYMQPDDVLLSVSHNGETRAYPFRILNWHEIVNDQIGDLHFAATYCPLCGTAIVFDRNINNRILTFGVSGLLYFDNVLMYDHQTESLWSQLFLKSVTGSQFGTPLQFLPSEQMLYSSWREKYPEGVVLSNETGHDRNYNVDPYADYFLDPDPLFPVGDIRNDLPAKAWVFGVLVDGAPIAYAREQLPANEAFEHTFNDQRISVFYDAASQNIQVTDPSTGEQLPGLWSFWFAWQAFHRETALWSPSTE